MQKANQADNMGFELIAKDISMLEISKTQKFVIQEELPVFLSDLEKYGGQISVKLDLQLLTHTFVRTKELRGAF